MARHIAVVGAGALGSFVGGHAARAGHDVTLIDAWPAHIDAIRERGLRLQDPAGESLVRLPALHISEVQSLHRKPVDFTFVCVKVYDTDWAVSLIAPYLAAGGFVVTMQNALVEERVARIVGWGRTLGAIASTINVMLAAPGHVVRTSGAGGQAYTVFRVGEVHGLETGRAHEVARVLALTDSARVTSNLWGERWSKLVQNSMTAGLSAVAGMTFREIYENAVARRLIIRLAAEAIEVGRVLGYALEKVRGEEPDLYLCAARGDSAAMQTLEAGMLRSQQQRPENGRSGVAQDLAKGRRTEIDFMNGFVAERGREAQVATPAHLALVQAVHAISRGECAPGMDALLALSSAVDARLEPAAK